MTTKKSLKIDVLDKAIEYANDVVEGKEITTCASVVASVINGYCKRDSDIKVGLLGGELIINYTSQGDVYMEGPAEFVYEGRIEDE